jgi:hypothetical protein
MNLPPVITIPQPLLPEPSVPVYGNKSFPIVIITTRDIDLELFKSYGKVIQYEPCYNNIDLSQLDFKYLFLDLRKSDDRVYYQKHVAPLKDQVKEVLYHYPFEDYDDFDVDVRRTKIPHKQATVEMFHQLLFQPQLPKPRACLSFLAKVASYLRP